MNAGERDDSLMQFPKWGKTHNLPVLLLMTDPYCSMNPVLAMMLPVMAIYHESIESVEAHMPDE